MIDSSRSNCTKPFEDQRPAAEFLPRGLALRLRAEHGLPLAVVAEAARLQHGGQADVARWQHRTRPVNQWRRTAASGCRATRRTPSRPAGPATLRAPAAAGYTGTRSASQRAVSTGTFSNSNVTTSEAFASSKSAWKSSNSPRMCAQTCAGTRIGGRDRERCSGRRADSPPARSSVPSCPPPRMPTRMLVSLRFLLPYHDAVSSPSLHGVVPMATPLTVVIFGASGDLTSRKLIPALFNLAQKGRLPPRRRSSAWRARRSPTTPSASTSPRRRKTRHGGGESFDGRSGPRSPGASTTSPPTPTAAGGMAPLQTGSRPTRAPSGGRRLYYLSVSAGTLPGARRRTSARPASTRKTAASAGWSSRSRSATTWPPPARSTRRCTSTGARTSSTASTTTSARTRCRTSSSSASPTRCSSRSGTTSTSTTCRSPWPRRSRSASRGAYYDGSGVLRDMFQNHLLQVLTMVAMEDPTRFTADNLRNEKMKVLDAIPVPTAARRPRSVVASGSTTGYRERAGRAGRTRETPTYRGACGWRSRTGAGTACRSTCVSGKGLTARYSEVMIQFRCPSHLMFPLPPGEVLQCNRMTLVHPAERGHPPELPDQGARRGRRAACSRATWRSTTSRPTRTRRCRRPTSGCCSTRCRATRRCSCEPTRSSGRGRSWTRSSRRPRVRDAPAAGGVRGRLAGARER